MLSVSGIKKLAGLSGKYVGSTLGNGKEGNLHTLEHTDDAHEDEENDYGNSWWYTVPQSGLSGEKGNHGDGNTESKYGQREKTGKCLAYSNRWNPT